MHNSFMHNIIKIGLIFNFFINEVVDARVTTSYTNGLSLYSSTFMRPYGTTKDYYFHAIVVRNVSTDSYSFTSNSKFDIYGSFHHYPVDITTPSKSMITYDDDSGGGREFRINLGLQSDKTYVLLVSSFSPNVTGQFTIIVEGPSGVELIHDDYFVLESTTTTTILPMFTSTYSGFLSSDNLQFIRPSSNSNNHYYQTIEITAPMNSTYIFMSSSSFDAYGYFYENSFDPRYPDFNLISSNDDGGDDANTQFRINVTLQYRRKYILVVTSFGYNITGAFLIKAIGPTSLNLTPIDQIKSYYHGALFCGSPTFSRLGSTNDHGCYFYRANRIEISTNGFYTFFSNSSMDTYGYLYNNSFDPSRPFLNLIPSIHDDSNYLYFGISYTLQSAGRYILVVTTGTEDVQGTFRITAVGPSSVAFNSFTSTTDHYQLCNSCIPSYPSTSSKKKTIAIVVPICTLLIIIVICCCVCRCKRKRMRKQLQNVQTEIVTRRNIQRSEVDVPYTIPLARVSDHLEQQPPTYESIGRI